MASSTRVGRVKLKTGDMVVAIAGDSAGTGKSGKVLHVNREQNRAVVEGLNLVKKTLRKSQDQPQGGIIDKEAPIHISNLRLVDAADHKSAAKKKTRNKSTRKDSDA